MKRKTTVALIAALGVISAAQAGTMTFNGVDNWTSVVTIGGTHYSGNVYAGLLKFDESSLGTLKTFCVDLDHAISSGQSWPDSIWETSTYGVAGVQYAGNLIAADYAQVDSKAKAVGLQLAIWEARYDDINNPNPDFDNGEFTASGMSSGALAAANSFWQDRLTPGNALLIRNENGHGQDQLTPVPEPASLAAIGIGFAALLRRRRRMA